MKENKNTFHKELGKLGNRGEYYCYNCWSDFSSLNAIIELLDNGFEVYCPKCQELVLIENWEGGENENQTIIL